MVEIKFKHLRDLARSLRGLENRLENELAGMFSVAIVATYEDIIKETLIDYSGKIHPKFQTYIENDFEKINARIRWNDLNSYAVKFGLDEWQDPASQKTGTIFDGLLKQKREIVERRFRRDLMRSYDFLLDWRNGYAHELSTPPVTFKDVYDTHRTAQYVIRTFVKTFDGS